MEKSARRGWIVVIAFLMVNVTVMGAAIGTMGVFITPLVREFHWTRAQVSLITTAWAIGLALSNPIAGWSVERLNARWLVPVGAMLTALALFVASRVHSLAPLVGLYGIIGLGCSFTGHVPLIVSAVNWFEEQSATAVGVGEIGISLGIALSSPAVAWVVVRWGWRVGMLATGLPMLVLAVPVALLFIRTSPDTHSSRVQLHQDRVELAGLNLGPALKTWPFWLLVVGNVAFTLGNGAMVVHAIPYLITVHYSAQLAANIFGFQAAFSALGHVTMGFLADRFGVKRMMVAGFLGMALSALCLVGAGLPHLGLLPVICFTVLFGFDQGADMLVALVAAQALGRRRFGTITGLLYFASAAGHSMGPLVLGKAFDVSGNYRAGLELCSLIIALGALAAMMVFPARGSADQVVSAAA